MHASFFPEFFFSFVFPKLLTTHNVTVGGAKRRRGGRKGRLNRLHLERLSKGCIQGTKGGKEDINHRARRFLRLVENTTEANRGDAIYMVIREPEMHRNFRS